MIGGSHEPSDLDSELAGLFDLHLKLEPISEFKERLEVLKWLKTEQAIEFSSDVMLNDIAKKTAGFTFEDYQALLLKAKK